MLSDRKIAVSAAVISHTGNVRTNNEDNFFFDGFIMEPDHADEGYRTQMDRTDRFHLFGICDGMGGLEGGERASYIGVREMQMLFRPIEDRSIERMIRNYAMKTTDLVLADSRKNGKNQKEGTTMVLLYLYRMKGYVANIGDSRIYLLRRGKLTQISRDHSQVFQMMLRGELTREEMRKHPKANAISHYIGMQREKINDQYINFETVELENNDRFLICSDGLSDLLSFERIEGFLSSEDSPLDAAERLVMEALELGGKDNTTAMIINISGLHARNNSRDKLPGLNCIENSPTAD